jgi:hypothetical protein
MTVVKLCGLVIFVVLTASNSAHAGSYGPPRQVKSTEAASSLWRVAGKPRTPVIAEECKSVVSWDEAGKKCIEDRDTTLFRDAATKAAVPVAMSRERSLLSSSPLLPTLPPSTFTLEQEEAIGKERAMRGLENQDRLDVQQDLRDQIRTLLNSQ